MTKTKVYQKSTPLLWACGGELPGADRELRAAPWMKQIHSAVRDAVKVWIIDKQLGQRNLPKYDKVILEDKKRGILAEQAKKNIGGDRKSDQYRENHRHEIMPMIGNTKERARNQNRPRQHSQEILGKFLLTVRNLTLAKELTNKIGKSDKKSCPRANKGGRPKKLDKKSCQVSKERQVRKPKGFVKETFPEQTRSELAIQGKTLISKKAKERQSIYYGNQYDSGHCANIGTKSERQDP